MGNASSTNLSSIVTALKSGPAPETGDENEDLYWNQLLPNQAIPILTLFSELQPENIREILHKQPRNLALLLLKVSYS